MISEPVGVQLIWTVSYFAATETDAWRLTISRRVRVSRKPRLRTGGWVSRSEPPPSPGTAWFSSATPAGEKGVKGRMYALEAKTGRIVWEFYLVPKGPNDPTRGPQGATPLDSSTWGNEPDTPITGGATWSSYSLDPERGELYIPTGNAAPNFAKGPRKGTNLYSGSFVVLDAKTGAYVRHYMRSLPGTGTIGTCPTHPHSSGREPESA